MLERLADLDPDAVERRPVSTAMSADKPPAGAAVHPIRRSIRYYVSRIAASTMTRAWMRPRLEGRERLPPGPAIYCFNHLSWSDPFMLMATLPWRPRLFFFGPKEEDMRVGGRNRVMFWTGTAIPYKPGKNDLLEATRRVGRRDRQRRGGGDRRRGPDPSRRDRPAAR